MTTDTLRVSCKFWPDYNLTVCADTSTIEEAALHYVKDILPDDIDLPVQVQVAFYSAGKRINEWTIEVDSKLVYFSSGLRGAEGSHDYA